MIHRPLVSTDVTFFEYMYMTPATSVPESGCTTLLCMDVARVGINNKIVYQVHIILTLYTCSAASYNIHFMSCTQKLLRFSRQLIGLGVTWLKCRTSLSALPPGTRLSEPFSRRTFSAAFSLLTSPSSCSSEIAPTLASREKIAALLQYMHPHTIFKGFFSTLKLSFFSKKSKKSKRRNLQNSSQDKRKSKLSEIAVPTLNST